MPAVFHDCGQITGSMSIIRVLRPGLATGGQLAAVRMSSTARPVPLPLPLPEVCDAWRLRQNRLNTRGQLVGGIPVPVTCSRVWRGGPDPDGDIAVRRGELQQVG